jgi:mono/diheme cytochrome c family protein
MACGLLLAGPSQVVAHDAAAPRSRVAEQLFARYCSQCHGSDGKGAPGRVTLPTTPDFTNGTWQRSRSNVQMMISILEGKDRAMPANGGMISEQLARDLVAYVRTFAPQPARAAVASAAPKPSPAPTTTPSAPGKTTALAPVPDYTPTGDFEVDYDNLAKQFDAYRQQVHELDLVSASRPPVTATPATAAPPVPQATSVPPVTAPPPSDSPPVSTPPAAVSPASPAESSREKPGVASVPISDRPFTPDDIARGEELFLGRRSLANGGTACVACHVVNRGDAREGGRLGPQLTKAYERLGGRTALSAHLWAPPTRTMRAAYLVHNLEPDEVLTLVAYLEDADKHAAEDTSPLRLKFLLMGLGGAALGLVALSALWGARARPGGQATPPAALTDSLGARR